MVPSYPPATRTSPLRSLVAVKNARALFIGFAGVQVIACAQAAGAKLVAAAVRIIAAARRRHFLAPIPVFRSWMMFCLFMILISFLFITADSRFNGKLQALTSFFSLFWPSLISRRAAFAKAPACQREIISDRSRMYNRKFGLRLRGKMVSNGIWQNQTAPSR